MKFFKYTFISALLLLCIQSCKKEEETSWQINLENPGPKVDIIDISSEFYNAEVPLDDFTQKYPWFQGTVPDEDFALRRKDAEEEKIYKEAISKINLSKLNTDLSSLFGHIKFYFPDFANPKVYLYSSALQGALEPVFYKPQENLLFIDITGFMGQNNPNYKFLNIISTSFLTAIEKPLESVIVSMGRSIVFIVIPLFTLPKIIGPIGIWLSIPIAESLCLLVSFVLMKRAKNYLHSVIK